MFINLLGKELPKNIYYKSLLSQGIRAHAKALITKCETYLICSSSTPHNIGFQKVCGILLPKPITLQ